MSNDVKTVAFAGHRLFMKFVGLDYFRERARETNLTIVEARAEDESALIEQLRDAHAIGVIGQRISARVIAALSRCELIQTLSVGYDVVDITAATEAGIPVCNTPAYCTDEVASHAMTLILAVARKLHVIMSEEARGVWDFNFARPIHALGSSVLGIIGLGRIGRALVPKARGFGMRVVAYDPYLDDDVFERFGVERRYELIELLQDSDFISIHTPLSAETRNMIGPVELKAMKPTAFIVNTARGPVWDEEAVAAAISSGQIAGGASDVTVVEPPPDDHPFLRLPGMILTPHIAWYSEDSLRQNMVDAMDEITRVLAGRRPRAIVNPEVLVRR